MSYKVTCLSDSAQRPKAEDCKDEQEYKLKGINLFIVYD